MMDIWGVVGRVGGLMGTGYKWRDNCQKDLFTPTVYL